MQNFNPYSGTGFDLYNSQPRPFNNNPMANNPRMQAPINRAQSYYDDMPVIITESNTTHKPLFSVSKSEAPSNPINISGLPNTPNTNNRKRKSTSTSKSKSTKSESNENNTEVANSSNTSVSNTNESLNGEVIDSTLYTYQETNNLLHETLGQIDAINSELVNEFNNVRSSRTMKNKYNILNDLSENIGSMINNRISTIKEINNCITKSNDLDYKRYKDMKAAQSVMNDDKYIADLYQAFMQNPQNMAPTYQMPQMDQSLLGSGVVRLNLNDSDLNNGNIMDSGYLNYLSNMTPEQNLMRYENNPNVKQVVVYDAATGNKFFQMMDTSTGEVIPNVPVYDEMIMEDTVLDIEKGVAKNLNLRETFPIIQINNDITSQY